MKSMFILIFKITTTDDIVMIDIDFYLSFFSRSASSGGVSTNMRREVSVVLTKISRRTSVRTQKSGVTTNTPTSGPTVQKNEPTSPPVGVQGPKETVTSVSSPAVTTPHRRKTRSQASDSNSGRFIFVFHKF